MLYMIGIGLCDQKDISLNALDTIKGCSKIYLENYTSVLKCNVNNLKKLYGKEIILADRNMVESDAEKTILTNALEQDVAFLVVGDVLSATTHADLVLRAKKKGIKVRFFHNASVMNAISETGLELYKFGKTTSMVFFEDNWKPATPYDVVEMNLSNGLHTLILLDIKVAEPSKEDILKSKNKAKEPKFMTVNQCLSQILELEKERKKEVFNEDTKVIGCARLGCEDAFIKYGKINELMKKDFGEPLHCVIVPGKLHFIEEEFLERL